MTDCPPAFKRTNQDVVLDDNWRAGAYTPPPSPLDNVRQATFGQPGAGAEAVSRNAAQPREAAPSRQYPVVSDRMNQEAWTPPPEVTRGDQSVYSPPARFYGINLGIAKLGVTDEGSINAGVNIGIAKAEVKAGLRNEVRAGVDLGPIVSGEAGVGAGINRNGLFAGTDVNAQALTIVGADSRVGANLGKYTGAHTENGAFVGPAEGRGRAYGYVSQNGLDSGIDGSARIGDLAGVNHTSRMNINENSQIRTEVGGFAGDYAGQAGMGVWSDGNRTVRPNAYAFGTAGSSAGAWEANPRRDVPSNVVPMERPLESAPQRGGRIERQELPPIEAAPRHQRAERPAPLTLESATETPAQKYGRIQAELRKQVAERSTVVGHKGMTYMDVMKQLRPDCDESQLTNEARYLARINHNKPIREGTKIQTLTSAEIDWETKKAVHKAFGWPMPRS